jgi:hypothetical protein
MISAREDCFSAELLDRFLDAIVVSSDDYARNAFGLAHALDYVLNHRAPCDRRERLPRQPCGRVARGDYREYCVRVGFALRV